MLKCQNGRDFLLHLFSILWRNRCPQGNLDFAETDISQAVMGRDRVISAMTSSMDVLPVGRLVEWKGAFRQTIKIVGAKRIAFSEFPFGIQIEQCERIFFRGLFGSGAHAFLPNVPPSLSSHQGRFRQTNISRTSSCERYIQLVCPSEREYEESRVFSKPASLALDAARAAVDVVVVSPDSCRRS